MQKQKQVTKIQFKQFKEFPDKMVDLEKMNNIDKILFLYAILELKAGQKKVQLPMKDIQKLIINSINDKQRQNKHLRLVLEYLGAFIMTTMHHENENTMITDYTDYQILFTQANYMTTLINCFKENWQR